MAVIYLSSVDGNNSNNGSTWALAKANLAEAMHAAGNGGTVYVDHAHNESKSATVVYSGGIPAQPINIICVDRTGNPEPPSGVMTTANIGHNGGAISCIGFAFIYGMNFHISGVNSNNIRWVDINPFWWKFDNCQLRLSSTNGNCRIEIGETSSNDDDQLIELYNTRFQFGNVNQGIISRARFRWAGTPLSGVYGTIPTKLFTNTGGLASDILVHGVDLSAISGAKSLVAATVGAPHQLRFENCKFGSGISILDGAIPGQGGTNVDIVNCDFQDTNYRYEKYRYQGKVIQDTTVKRTGGASDGTTGLSFRMMTGSGSYVSPLVSDPICFWNDVTGSGLTTTVEILSSGVTLKDNEAWIETEYLGTNGFPLSIFTSDRSLNILSSGVAQPLSSGTWTTTGIPSPIAQKFETTFTPQEKGLVKITVNLARPSHQMWYCPKVTVS